MTCDLGARAARWGLVILAAWCRSLAGQAPAGATEPAAVRPATVTAGAHYRAGWLHRWLLGAHYRDLWTTPVQVEVVDLTHFGGGLTPLKRGGGRQTKSLRLRAADGHTYIFRSVDKDPTAAIPPELRATFVQRILEDQTSSTNPAGALVVGPLLGAAGVHHVEPRLMVMPDDPRLDSFPVFKGMLGHLEERPTVDPEEDVGFEGADRIASTQKVWDRLTADSRHRVDSRASLAARLVDVLVGDWDRHPDQWRWARFDEDPVHVWRPIPRDRDQAFSRLDGLLPRIARYYHPDIVSFGDRYPDLVGLTWNGRALDRRVLTDLEKPVWASVAGGLQAGRAVSVFSRAVDRLPPEHCATNGTCLSRAMRRPCVGSPLVAGGGAVIESTRSGRTFFYVDHTPARVISGPRSSVDRADGRGGPQPDPLKLQLRDWGTRWTPAVRLSFAPDLGVLAGVRETGTWFGFRQDPYKSQLGFGVSYAAAAQAFRGTLSGDFRDVIWGLDAGLELRASGIEVVRFYGFGNETVARKPDDAYRVRQGQYLIAPSLVARSRQARFSVGTGFRFGDTARTAGSFVDSVRPYGSADFLQVGAQAQFRVDGRDRARAPGRGGLLALGGGWCPAAHDVAAPFGEAHGEAAAYLTARIPLQPTLALRIAGKKVWGTYPFQEAAYIGGATTVRGFSEHRFAGDGALYGNAELRLGLVRLFVLVPEELGVFGLADGGRVYLAGETSDRWHAAVGGGLWVAFLSRTNTLSVAAAHSVEGTRAYVRAGFGF